MQALLDSRRGRVGLTVIAVGLGAVILMTQGASEATEQPESPRFVQMFPTTSTTTTAPPTTTTVSSTTVPATSTTAPTTTLPPTTTQAPVVFPTFPTFPPTTEPPPPPPPTTTPPPPPTTDGPIDVPT